MTDQGTLPETQRTVSIRWFVEALQVSPATAWRMHSDHRLPASLKIGRSVRWRLRTGDPATGALDWLEAGCPPLCSISPASETEA
ncbi:MAG: putative DNA-binding transcriptional regulator AlpA [Planctomycetaceae bacterium]